MRFSNCERQYMMLEMSKYTQLCCSKTYPLPTLCMNKLLPYWFLISKYTDLSLCFL